MKRFFLVTFAFVAINTFAFAGIDGDDVATVDGAIAERPYFNGDNEITITVTLSGTDATDWHGNDPSARGLFLVYCDFALQNDGTPATDSGRLTHISEAFFYNNVATVSLTGDVIDEAADDNLELDQKPFDLWIRLKSHTAGTEEGSYRALSFYSTQASELIWDEEISNSM